MENLFYIAATILVVLAIVLVVLLTILLTILLSPPILSAVEAIHG